MKHLSRRGALMFLIALPAAAITEVAAQDGTTTALLVDFGEKELILLQTKHGHAAVRIKDILAALTDLDA